MKAFIDSNVLIYYTLGESARVSALQNILSDKSIKTHISTQVVNEFCNLAIRKNMCSEYQALGIVEMFLKTYIVEPVTPLTTLEALKIKSRYKFGFYDSLIIATALQSGCELLYIEDMQHGFSIGKKLKLINPFH